jgi:hypothetical protein
LECLVRYSYHSIDFTLNNFGTNINILNKIYSWNHRSLFFLEKVHNGEILRFSSQPPIFTAFTKFKNNTYGRVTVITIISVHLHPPRKRSPRWTRAERVQQIPVSTSHYSTKQLKKKEYIINIDFEEQTSQSKSKTFKDQNTENIIKSTKSTSRIVFIALACGSIAVDWN